jgi:sigma-54-specific transcriptional regulator
MSILEFSRPTMPPGRARALVFESPLSRALLTLLEQIAPTDTTVLVTGETGTGKEVVARFLHDHSARAKGPYVAVNCGALSPTLLESELFGHERGAFTGAATTRPGFFEAADKGTLFLDEVADLPLAGQVKLLRVLQEHEVVRVGARRACPVDVRVIAATNVNLAAAVRAGRFREDLFYRLHVAHAALAPLRERSEDILPLARHFLTRHAARFGRTSPQLTPQAVAKLVGYGWPGNIRELENVVQRALLQRPGGVVDAEHVQLVIDEPAIEPISRLEPRVAEKAPANGAEPKRVDEARLELEQAMLVLLESGEPKLLEEIDALVFRAAFRQAGSNQVRTAQLLGVSRNIVRSRLMRHGLLRADARRAAASRAADEERAAGTYPYAVRALPKASPSSD